MPWAASIHSALAARRWRAHPPLLGTAGQLGDGASLDSSVPVDVGLGYSAAGVSAGGDHTCAVLVGGDTTCWGQGSDRQLGNNATTNSGLPVYMPRSA
jgi:hypothetical protein